MRSALKKLEYLLETTEDFKSLVDHNLASEKLNIVPIQLAALCQSLLRPYKAQCAEKSILLVFEQESEVDSNAGVIYSDPIRIRVLLKNILEYAVSNANSQSNITVRSVLRSHAEEAVVVIDIFEDNQHFADSTLSVLSSYFSGAPDFLEHEEYQSIPLEYRTANRVAHSLNGNISIKRCLNGGHIISIQFLAHLEPESTASLSRLEESTFRSDIFYFRQGQTENSIVERYLTSKGIQMRRIGSIPSLSSELNSADCELIFVELNPSAPDYAQELTTIQEALSSTNASIVALVEPGHENGSFGLLEDGFTDVIVKPVSASHIFSIIKANSSVSTSIQKIFTEQ